MKRILAVLLSLLFCIQLTGCIDIFHLSENKKPSANTSNTNNVSNKTASSLKTITGYQNNTTGIDNKSSRVQNNSRYTSAAINSTKIRNTTATIIGPGFYTPLAPQKYHLYNQLSRNQKTIYSLISTAAFNMEDSVNVGVCSVDDLLNIYKWVQNDYPQYFWLSKSIVYNSDGNNRILYFVKDSGAPKSNYLISKDERNAMQAKLDNVIKEALEQLKPGVSEYDRELLLHDFVASKTTYDSAAAANPKTNLLAFTAYGALVQGKAVCEGYARAFQLLLYNASIQNTLVVGTLKGSGHMWNVVEINEKWYHNDVTWDDTNNGGYHIYFNTSDKYIKADHTIDDKNFGIPVCNSMDKNYGLMNQTYITSEENFDLIILNTFSKNIPKGINKMEFNFGENYNRTFPFDVNSFNDFIEPLINQYNEGKIGLARINNCSVTGLPGSKGFMITKIS